MVHVFFTKKVAARYPACIHAHSMEDHGYNLRQRPFPVTISDQSSLPISTAASGTVPISSIATADNLTSTSTGLTLTPTVSNCFTHSSF